MISYLIIILFATGILLGRLIRNLKKMHKILEKIVNWAVYLLLFLLGISVGINKDIINNFSRIGYTAFWLTIGSVGACLVLARLVYFRFFRNTEQE